MSIQTDPRAARPRAPSLSVARSPLTSSPTSPPISISLTPFSALSPPGSSTAPRPVHARGPSLTRFRTSEPDAPSPLLVSGDGHADRISTAGKGGNKELRRVKTMDDVDEEMYDSDAVDEWKGGQQRRALGKASHGYDPEDGETDSVLGSGDSDTEVAGKSVYTGPFQRPDAAELWRMILSTSAVVIFSTAAILTTIYDWIL